MMIMDRSKWNKNEMETKEAFFFINGQVLDADFRLIHRFQYVWSGLISFGICSDVWIDLMLKWWNWKTVLNTEFDEHRKSLAENSVKIILDTSNKKKIPTNIMNMESI